jgi:glycosyltransferase involved in cell wall biosynthesis
MRYLMKQSELVSVVVPAFNCQDFILEALESLRDQTYKNLQVIIIDDGSTDNTGIICKNWCEVNLGYEYYYQENQGISSAINRGIELAIGKYIARMDADDIACNSRISEQVSFLQNNKHIDLVSSGYKPFQNSGKSFQSVMHPSDFRIVALLLSYCSPVCHPAVLARREVFENFKYDQVAVAEDHELWCRIASFHNIANIDKVLLFYRRHTTSLSHLKLRKIRIETLKNGTKYFIKNHNSFSCISYKLCIEQLSNCQSIKLWPALIILTFAKIMSLVFWKKRPH